jgi:hypothetical protein
MKPRHLRKGGGHLLLCTVMILGALLLIGCGSSGDAGPPGATGATGPTGPPGSTAPGGSLATTSETCSICHSAGKIADVADFHPDPTGQDVAISDITLTNSGGIPAVSFHAATASGSVTDLVFADVRFYIADLVPAGTPTIGYTATQGTWDSPYFERWASETSSTAGAVFDTTDAANGNYTYTFATAFADATTEAPDYNAAHTQRLVIRVSGHDDASGNAVTNNTVGFLDFVVPAAGASAVALDSQRQFVTADACKKCHGAPFQQAAHADGYLDTRACVICHSPIGHYGTGGLSGADMVADNAYLPVLIHQIHAAIDNPKFADQVRGLGFGGVTYPQEIEKCVVCHTDSGLTLGTGDQTDNWKDHPLAEICGSCHIDLNFTTGDNHAGGPQTNDTCTVCHPADGFGFGKSITTAHDTTPTGVNVPEFDVTLTITPPINGSYYDVGEAPEVRVTLTDHGSGIAVAPSLYTTPQDVAGHTSGGLAVASLYVYGPRAKSVPVLTTGSTDDPPAQSHNLFVLGTDPQVTSDITGFGYQLLPIPAGMTAGTYMVRVRIGDYGRVGTGNYHIESTAFTTIQIGTATIEEKVAGTACVNCHGTGTAAFHDERHAVVFDTDQCLACHDQSDNHAIPIANRVHAVHSANSDGDLYFILGEGTRDWSDVTFPQNIQMTDGDPRCVACHTSGDTTYKTNPFMMPCVGCHTNDGILDHMRQNGGPF